MVAVYDNMCHLDGMKAMKERLPFEELYDRIWGKIQKVIDHLHIKNHKDPNCLTLYNPKQIRA